MLKNNIMGEQMSIDRKVEVEFKVRLGKMPKDEAEKVNLVVHIKDEHLEDLIGQAMKSQVISWQSQVRNNWDKFLADDYEPLEEIEFGQPMFGPKKKTVVREMTEEEMIAKLLGDPGAMAKLMEKIGK